MFYCYNTCLSTRWSHQKIVLLLLKVLSIGHVAICGPWLSCLVEDPGMPAAHCFTLKKHLEQIGSAEECEGLPVHARLTFQVVHDPLSSPLTTTGFKGVHPNSENLFHVAGHSQLCLVCLAACAGEAAVVGGAAACAVHGAVQRGTRQRRLGRPALP